MRHVLFCLLWMLTMLVLPGCNDIGKSQTALTPAQQLLADSGWVRTALHAGDMPEHYGVKAKRSLSHNTFVINLEPGMGSMLIKVVSSETNLCERYICAEAGTLTRITQIRPGTYYLLLSYGKDWMEHPVGPKQATDGKFTLDAVYERSAIDFTFADTTAHSIVVRTQGQERTYNFPVGAIDEATFMNTR